MASVFPRLILSVAFFYSFYVYADAGSEPDVIRECSGKSITLDPGLLPDFYSGFEARVTESRRAFIPGDEGSCKTVFGINKIEDDSVLVDVRSSSQVTEFELNNTVNVPVHELKTKKFLRKRNLVLLDEAFRYYELLEECRLLKTLGFSKISVLAEGADSLAGSASSVDHIDPADFHALKQKWRWLIFDLTGNRYVSESTNLISLGSKPGKQLLSSRVEQGIENFYSRSGFYPHVLILDQDGGNYSLVLDAVAEKYRPHVFYLNGGMDGYQNFVVRQNTILEQKKRINSRSASPCGSLN